MKGERPIECAKRELFEETGIISNNLLEIGRVAEKEHHSFYVEYLCLADCNKKSIVVQEGETIDYKWVDYSKLIQENELATRRIFKFMFDLKGDKL